MPDLFAASAPGSMMLMGEHAVLWGAPCLVAAVDQRLTVRLKPRPDHQIILTSMHGQEICTLENLHDLVKHTFVAAVIKAHKDYLTSGFEIEIDSQVMNGKGFGSSAAVIAATQEVIHQYTQQGFSTEEKIASGRKTVQEVQGYGSGADIAAAVLGGIVYYETDPVEAKKTELFLPLTAIFCGYKTPTAEVIRYVEVRRRDKPEDFKSYTATATLLVKAAYEALKTGDLVKLGGLFEEYQLLMNAFGVEDQAARTALTFLRQQTGIKGAKISGSGLGDCVVGVGDFDCPDELPLLLQERGMVKIPVRLTCQGVD